MSVDIDGSVNFTPYISRVLGVRLANLPDDMKNIMTKEAAAMSAIGIDSEEDHKNFVYILLHTKKIAEDISGKKLDDVIIGKLSQVIFLNRSGSPIDTVFNFYRAVSSGLNKIGIPIKKMAYPSGQSSIQAINPRDVGKWMKTMREIYFMVHNGAPYKDAFGQVTAKWDIMEKNDFENWMKFYQEGAHEKYKTAQPYLQLGGDGAPMVPWDHLKAKLPSAPQGMPNMNLIENSEVKDTHQLTMKKIRSILSRFQSALKLLADPDVQHVLNKKNDMSLSDFIKQVQDLQRYILLLPPIKSFATLEDVIIQRGNRLIAQGYPKAGEMIKKFAQDAPPPEPPAKEPAAKDDQPSDQQPDIMGGAPEVPDAPGGEAPAGDVSGDMPNVDAVPTVTPPEEDWVQAFKDSLNYTDEEPKEEKMAVDDASMVDDMAEITVEAQAVPPMVTPPPVPVAPKPETPELFGLEEPKAEIEVEEEPEPEPEQAKPKAQDLKNYSLDGVTVADIVVRLERVSNILKNREIPRELAWIDFMLDKVGLASYFPSLAEATKSALESNQYMSTRVEEILSKLRGSMEPVEPIELTTTDEEEDATQKTLDKNVKRNLDRAEGRERAKRDRKQQESISEVPEMPVAPTVPETAPVASELTRPVNVKTAPPVPIRQ
jgi:hypothetical protein